MIAEGFFLLSVWIGTIATPRKNLLELLRTFQTTSFGWWMKSQNVAYCALVVIEREREPPRNP